MRKRLVIGATAALVIGVAAYMLSQPRKGSIDWHEREYWKAREGGPVVVGLLQWAFGMGGTVQTEEEVTRMNAHETVLVKNGRLVEHIVLVSNQPPDKVFFGVVPAVGAMQWDQVVFFELTTNAIRLVTHTNGAAARLSRLERLIRQADFPLTK